MPKSPENVALPDHYSVAGRSLPLISVANRRAKHLTLRLEPGGRSLRVTIPPRTNNAMVLHFIHKHHHWLEKRLKILPVSEDNSLKNGGFIPIFGVPHRIVHSVGRGVTTLRTEDGEEQIMIYGQEQFLVRRLRDFLKKQAETTLAPLVAQHAAAVHIKPRSISYKDTKSRWGSCSSERKLAFSWRLIMAPPGVINYLAAHEVAHLVELNHSARFWALCKKLCPDTEKQRNWLKINGQKLHAIVFD